MRRKGGLATRNQRKKRKLRLFRVFRVQQTNFPRFFANIIFFVYFCIRVGVYHPSSAQ